MTEKRERIVVTGFGAFGDFAKNPSEAIVDRLAMEQSDCICTDRYQLITQLLPVEYDTVAASLPHLWQTHQPILVIHVGVHAKPRTIHIEQQSFNRGYCRKDVTGNVPVNNECCENVSVSTDATEFDCSLIEQNVSRQLNDPHLNILVSQDPGRYLCAFSYFLSLNKDRKRSLFVHIAPPDHHVTVELQTEALKLIVAECLRQLESTATR